MPSRAPTYYHWAMDKPCTSNQTYGYDLKGTLTTDCAKTKAFPGPFDYTRPFSNCGFFPEIGGHNGGLVAKHKDSEVARSTASAPVRRSAGINTGYTLGPDPIHKRLVQRDQPAGVRLSRFQSAPSTYRYTSPAEKSVYLWHTLAGCLVHVKNSDQARAVTAR